MLEAIAAFIGEILFRVIGYFTGLVVVPLLSFGTARVAPAPKQAKLKPKWHGFYRGKDGKLLVDCEGASLIGILFWIAVAVLCAVLFGR